MRGFADIGKVYDATSLREHLREVDLSWAKGVTIHHTAFPNLAMRPKGFTVQHMHNIEFGYKRKGWGAGPHLFIDEDQAFGMTPFGMPGIHAVSFNRTHVGVELLGDYDDHHEVMSARGKAVIAMGVQCVAAICDSQGWDSSNINFHRDDPKTSKTCPGAHFPAAAFKQQVGAALEGRTDEPQEQEVSHLREELTARLANIQWQMDQIKRAIANLD